MKTKLIKYPFAKVSLEITIKLIIFFHQKLLTYKAIWPSGKAVDCKSSIPSSNLGVALKIVGVWWNGRHNRLKIC